MRVAILTISDRSARGERPDASGPKGLYIAMGDCSPGGPQEVIRTAERYRD